MKLFTLLLLLALPLFAACQDIQWKKDKPLTWEDFKGTPNQDMKAGAVTYSRINYSFHREGVDTPYHFAFTVRCLFNSDRSWVKKDYKNKGVLAHEQLHFDISEFYARMLYDALSKAVYTENYRSEMQAIFEDIHKTLRDVEQKYDAQVAKKNTAMQNLWNQQIHDELARHPSNY